MTHELVEHRVQGWGGPRARSAGREVPDDRGRRGPGEAVARGVLRGGRWAGGGAAAAGGAYWRRAAPLAGAPGGLAGPAAGGDGNQWATLAAAGAAAAGDGGGGGGGETLAERGVGQGGRP